MHCDYYEAETAAEQPQLHRQGSQATTALAHSPFIVLSLYHYAGCLHSHVCMYIPHLCWCVGVGQRESIPSQRSASLSRICMYSTLGYVYYLWFSSNELYFNSTCKQFLSNQSLNRIHHSLSLCSGPSFSLPSHLLLITVIIIFLCLHSFCSGLSFLPHKTLTFFFHIPKLHVIHFSFLAGGGPGDHQGGNLACASTRTEIKCTTPTTPTTTTTTTKIVYGC